MLAPSNFNNFQDIDLSKIYCPLIRSLTCGVVDLRSSDALRRETELDYAQ